MINPFEGRVLFLSYNNMHTNFIMIFFLILICFLTNIINIINGDTALIQSACKSTMHYELCISSLSSNPSSLNADTKGLAVIMIQIGISNATSTSCYLSSQATTTNNNNNNNSKKVIINKLCAEKYSNAAASLQNSLKELTTDQFDYAYVHVMAAADYPRACRTAFRQVPGLPYLPELASREDGLVHICEVVLGILDFLLGSAQAKAQLNA